MLRFYELDSRYLLCIFLKSCVIILSTAFYSNHEFFPLGSCNVNETRISRASIEIKYSVRVFIDQVSKQVIHYTCV
jgi:hypothetical protein